MLKLKTLRSASKRFKKTASGMLRYKHAYLRHILTKKSSKRKRNLRKKSIISKTCMKVLIKSLPHIRN